MVTLRRELSTKFCKEVPLDLLELLAETTSLDCVMDEGAKLEHELMITRNKLYQEVENSIVMSRMIHELSEEKSELEYRTEEMLNTINGLTENIKNLEGN